MNKILLPLILITISARAEDRYYTVYSNHKTYTSYNHTIDTTISIAIVVGICLLCSIFVCYFCRKFKDDETPDNEVEFYQSRDKSQQSK